MLYKLAIFASAQLAGAFSLCTLALAAAALGCILISVNVGISGHPLAALGVALVALACVAANLIFFHVSQLRLRRVRSFLPTR